MRRGKYWEGNGVMTFFLAAAAVLVLLVLLGGTALVIASEVSKRREQQTLASGRPVVTTLVMANNQLLEPDGIDAAPGVVVLSFDPPSRPLAEHMRAVGEKCFDLYTSDKTLELSPPLRDVALRMKADRYHSGRRTVIPPELAGPHRLYLADLWIVRKRLTGHFHEDRVLACAATGLDEGRLIHLPPEDPRTAMLLGSFDGVMVASLAPEAPAVSPPSPSFSPVGPRPIALAADAFAPRPQFAPGFPAPPDVPYSGPGIPPPPVGAPDSTRRVVWVIASLASAWLIGILVLFAVILYLGMKDAQRRTRPIAAKAAPTPTFTRSSDRIRQMLEEQSQRVEQERDRRAKERADEQARRDAQRKAEQDSQAERERKLREFAAPAPMPPMPPPQPIPSPSKSSSPLTEVGGTVVEALDVGRPLSVNVTGPETLFFGPAGSKLFVVLNDVWDADSGEKVRSLDVDQHEPQIRRLISADGRWLASAWATKEVKPKAAISVISLETGRRSFETSFEQYDASLRLQIVRNKVVMATDRSQLEFPVLDLATGEQKMVIKRESARLLIAPEFSPDGVRYVQARDESILVRATRTGEVIATLDLPALKGAEQEHLLPEQRQVFDRIQSLMLMNSTRAVRFSPDGREIAAIVAPRTRIPRLICWDENGRIVFDLEAPEIKGRRSYDEAPVWLPDGRGWIAHGAVIDRKSRRTVLLFAADSRKPARVHPVDHERILALTPSAPNTLRAFRIPWSRIQTALDNPASEKLPFIVP